MTGTNLLAPAIPAQNLLSSKLRVHMVEGPGMEPALRDQLDYVILAPVSAWCGEGIYLIDWGPGPVLYRAQNAGDGHVRLTLDNPLFRDNGHLCSRDQFNDAAIGFVVADIHVRDERFLREA